MATYESYKDSGVKWLGQIPSHWEVKKLRAFFDRRNHKVSDTEYSPLSVTKNGIVPQMENVAKSKDSDNRRLVRIGDFVINSRSDRKGSSGVSSLEGSVSFVNTVMTPRKGVVSDYCNYLLKSYAFIEENYRNGHGIVADLWTTSFEEQKLIKIAMPTPQEQEAIVAYLDKVTGEIDRAIETQQKMIEALNERKQIIITRAVTRGLNSDTPLKDSGIDWLGQIPEHWGVTQLKRFASLILGKMLDTRSGSTINWSKYICAKDVHFDGIDTSDLKMMYFSEKDKNLYRVKNGDILIVEGGAGAGGCAIVKDIQEDTYIQNSIIIIRPCETLNREYLTYLMQSLVKRGYIEYACNKATIPHFTKEKVGRVQITVPTINEQENIVSYINAIIKPIEESIVHCESMISLLQERKQIIINEVVTGKKKVI